MAERRGGEFYVERLGDQLVDNIRGAAPAASATPSGRNLNGDQRLRADRAADGLKGACWKRQDGGECGGRQGPRAEPVILGTAPCRVQGQKLRWRHRGSVIGAIAAGATAASRQGSAVRPRDSEVRPRVRARSRLRAPRSWPRDGSIGQMARMLHHANGQSQGPEGEQSPRPGNRTKRSNASERCGSPVRGAEAASKRHATVEPHAAEISSEQAARRPSSARTGQNGGCGPPGESAKSSARSKWRTYQPGDG